MNEIMKVAIQLAATLIIGIGMFMFNKYLKPWLVENNLMTAAQIAVRAAQAVYGRYNGEEKLKVVLGRLQEKGFDITAQQVLSAINAAWQKMNNDQIAAGVKQA